MPPAHDAGWNYNAEHPCDGCVHARTCATGHACDAFLVSVRDPRTTRWRSAAREPSRELFAAFVALERVPERRWRSRAR